MKLGWAASGAAVGVFVTLVIVFLAGVFGLFNSPEDNFRDKCLAERDAVVIENTTDMICIRKGTLVVLDEMKK